MTNAPDRSQHHKYTGICIDCGHQLELYSLDIKKQKHILQCPSCGLYHYYKKDILGKWKLVKAAKIPDI